MLPADPRIKLYLLEITVSHQKRENLPGTPVLHSSKEEIHIISPVNFLQKPMDKVISLRMSEEIPVIQPSIKCEL